MKNRKSNLLRYGVQLFFFLLIAFIAINYSLAEIGKPISPVGDASLHAVCPFGGVVFLYQLSTGEGYVKNTHASSLILMIIVFVISILFGPAFCGWICPFGSLQEWLGKLGRKLFKKKFNAFLPPKLDRILRYVRYAVFAWVVFMAARSAEFVFFAWDPYFALFNFWTGEVAISGYAVLGAVIVFSLFVERPFCKYACPYGALLGLFNLIRFFPIRRNSRTCIACGACDRACPMNISVSTALTVRHHQCISCLKCTSEKACPVDVTVEMSSKSLGSAA